MKWLKDYKQKFSLRVFRKRAKNVKFPHKGVDLERAKKIGIIVNMNMMTSKDLIILTDFITRLEDTGKQLILIELNFKRKTEPMFNETNQTIFINPTQISWLGFPSREALQEINKNKIDILLNLDISDLMTSRFICGLSNASTRAGFFEEGYEEFYEFMLDIPKETKLKELLTSFETYLKMIEK